MTTQYKVYAQATVLLVFLACLVVGQTNCPQSAAGLVNFNTLQGWNVSNSEIVISKPVKMNVSPPNKLRSIVVKSGGSLIFDNVNLSINLDFIRVESNGSFVMGSATCPITNKIVLTFYGSRVNSSSNDMGTDPFDNSKSGSKGIVFMSGSKVQMYGFVNGPSWTELSATVEKGSHNITLSQNVSWRVGDSIVVASTDFGELMDYKTVTNATLSWVRGVAFPDMNEERVITQILNGGRTLVLNKPLNFTHYSNGNMKGEVGLLTRRIVFQGDNSSDTSLFGGHFIIRLVNQFQVQGIEIQRFGQRGLMGRYSFHFHLLQNTAASSPFGVNYFVKDCSVHSSYQRCYVVHDTNYILLENNVCFDAFGHTFFLEDGSEVGNVFRNNLAIRPKPVTLESGLQLIPSDVDVSAFWITNPNNTFIGNRAVGGKFGFWFTMPTFPTGLSANRYPAGSINPRAAPPQTFDRNVAHSGTNGLFIDQMEKADGTSELAGYYPSVEAVYSNFTAYKNRQYGIWARGGLLTFRNLYLADNKFQMNSPPGPSIIFDSVMIGESDNTGDASFRTTVDTGGRTRPAQYFSTTRDLIKGYETYDNGGPNYLYNVTFRNFVTNNFTYAGALSSLNNQFKLQTRNRYGKLTFDNANRYMVFPESAYQNHRAAALMDTDGSITGLLPGGWITGNDSVQLFDDCTPQPSWNAYSCPLFGESWGQLRVINFNLTATNTTSSNGTSYPELSNYGKLTTRMILVDLLRNRQTKITGAMVSANQQFYMQANIPARGFYAIRWAYDIPTPKDLSFFLDSVATNDWVVLAIQYPIGSTFIVQMGTTNLTRTDSLKNVISSPGLYYYHDRTTEHLYIKLKNTASRTSYREVYMYADYYTAGVITINATCPNNNCAPSTFSNPGGAALIYKHFMKEDQFVGRLEMCQQAAVKSLAAGSTSGQGLVFAFLNYDDRSLDFTLHHNLNPIVTSIEVGIGLPGTESRILSAPYRISPYSQSRFGVNLSYNEWIALLKGQLFVKVSTSQNPTGHLRAQLYCNNGTVDGNCQIPPLIPAASACDAPRNSSQVIELYTEGTQLASKGWNFYSSSNALDERSSLLNTTYTASPICGNSSLYIGMRRGSVTIYRNTATPIYVDSSVYQYFEFYIQGMNSSKEINLALNFYKHNGTTYTYLFLKTVNVVAKYIQHFKIDETTLTRVRIPVTDFFAESVQNIQRIIFYLYTTGSYKEMLIDNIRFVGYDTNPSAISASEIVKYGTVGTCGQSSNPDPDPLGIRSL